jgi:hypothetical protein
VCCLAVADCDKIVPYGQHSRAETFGFENADRNWSVLNRRISDNAPYASDMRAHSGEAVSDPRSARLKTTDKRVAFLF